MESDGWSIATEALVEKVLAMNVHQKLLSFADGVQLDTFLLLHPSPKNLARPVVRQRPVEDLILLMMVLGIASNLAESKSEGPKHDAMLGRMEELMRSLRAESPEFETFAAAQTTALERLNETTSVLDGFIKASAKRGFDPVSYADSHPALLSLTVDQYLIARIVTHKGAGLQNLIDGTWLLRLTFYDCRHARS